MDEKCWRRDVRYASDGGDEDAENGPQTTFVLWRLL
jgi:hypothetical protein